MPPAASSYNYSHDVSPSYDGATRLPPISQLLQSPLQDGRDDPRPRHSRDNSRAYSPSVDGSRRPLYDRQSDTQHYSSHHLPTPPADDRHRDRSSYGRPPPSMSSGPPGMPSRPPPEWDRGGPRTAYDYGAAPSNVSPSYSAPGRNDRAGRESGSNLPPPPPFQQGHPPNYGGANMGNYGDQSPYGSGYPRHSPTYPPNGYHAQPQYPPHQRPDQPPPYSDGGYSRDHGMQMYESMEDRPPRRRRGNLPKWATDYLKQWFFDHIAHPYPTEQEKQELCKITGLGMTQLSNWFINARRRQNPVLHAQAQAENMIRENSSQTSGGSDNAT